MELTVLLEEARVASPAQRIEWRDPIAAYGARAIEGVRPWLTDGVLSAFAVRVIERAGSTGESELATQILRAARKRVPAGVSADVGWALQRLRAASRPQATTPSTPASAGPASPVRREPPRYTLVARRRAR